ncbi:MAG TPA: IS256 family transposase, partial [Acidimicrobiales bacterium]|nr:IS256 family transposase [Acidimicrobiales bacterium]
PTPVAPRVSPTETIRAEIHAAFDGEGDLLSAIEQVARLSVRLTFQSVIEEIMVEELCRKRYERRGEDSPEGLRNGFQPPRTIKTTLGPVELRRPKLRHAHSALCDQLFGATVSRTNALETLVISAWVRGVSDRDVEAMLAEVFGKEAAISPSTVSRICQRLRSEFEDWRRRDLSGTRIDYLYLDGSYFKMHPKAKAEPVLVAWGIDTDGKPVFLGLGPGATESADAWIAFLTDLTERKMPAPLLVISDGGKGLCAAIERCFPHSVHQRCTIHVCRNVLAKVPKHAQAEVKGDYWAIFDKIEGSGDKALAEGRRRARRFIAKWKPLYPSAVACVEENLEALLVYLAFPAEHHKRIRHSNLIERTFGETRRRVKVIGRLPGEQSCLSLVWAVLDRASKGWRGLTMTPDALRHLQDLRRQLLEPPTALQPDAVEEAAVDAETAAA